MSGISKSSIVSEVSPELASALLDAASRINVPSFVDADPVQFPRRFSRLEDIEISALVASLIAWGKRSMIIRDANRILDIMEHEPLRFVMEGEFETLDPGLNLHRTFFARDLQWLARGLRRVYTQYGSLDAFAAAHRVGDEPSPAWRFAELLGNLCRDANAGAFSNRCLPANIETTPLKRINMMLRWLVRDDGIVDLGVWNCIPKSKLFIPLDIHVANTARSLGILSRRSNDRKTVQLLTDTLRPVAPDDPALLDFALFGLGVNSSDLFLTQHK